VPHLGFQQDHGLSCLSAERLRNINPVANCSGVPVAILRELIQSNAAIEQLHIAQAEFNFTKRMALNYLVQLASSANCRPISRMVSDSRGRVT
jgi:hypothetical protein